MTTYHRYTNGTVDCANIGYMMCVADDQASAHYGENHYTIDISSLNVITAEELIARVEARIHHLDGLSPLEIDCLYLLNPANIVDTAGYWDDMEAIAWIFEQVSGMDALDGVTTEDGFISFNSSHFTKI